MSNADWMFAEFRATGYYESEDFRNDPDPADDEDAAALAEADWWEATEPPADEEDSE